MRYCEASAKDNFNVDEIFLKLVDDILSKVEPKESRNVNRVICSIHDQKERLSTLSSGGIDVLTRSRMNNGRVRPLCKAFSSTF